MIGGTTLTSAPPSAPADGNVAQPSGLIDWTVPSWATMVQPGPMDTPSISSSWGSLMVKAEPRACGWMYRPMEKPSAGSEPLLVMV